MSARLKVPRETEAAVLLRSRRRCAICFGMHRDAEVKNGQIAHLDGDSSNNDIDNLAFLCLDHHDAYDSRTSQSKGLTITEVKVFRAELEEAMQAALAAPISLGAASEVHWPGVYRWKTADAAAELTIERVSDDTYAVRGLAFWGTRREYGPNIGEIEQTAVLKGNRLTVSSDGYELVLRQVGSGVVAEERGSSPALGMNVTFAGFYSRVPRGAQALPQPEMRSFESEFWPEEGIPVLETRARELILRSRPSIDAPVTAVVSVEPGSRLPFSGFRYRTVRPGRVLVHEQCELSGRNLGATDYVSRANYYNDGGEEVTVHLMPGDRLEYLQYRAEGSGFIRWQGLVLDVPTLPWYALKRPFELVASPVTESWVQVDLSGKSGWVLVDGAVIETGREF